MRVGPSRRTPILLAICPVRSNLSPLPSNLHSPLPLPPHLPPPPSSPVIHANVCISQLTPSNLHLPQSCSPVYLNIPCHHGHFAHDDWVLRGTQTHVPLFLPPSLIEEKICKSRRYTPREIRENDPSRVDSIFLHLHNP